MSDADVEIEVKPKSICVVVNPHADEAARQPNMMQTAASELFYNMDRIRTQISAGHTKEDLDFAVHCFGEVKREMGL